MNKQVIFISIILMLICIGFQSVAAVPDAGVPVLSAVVKTPDVSVPTHYSPPSIVSPISHESGPPAGRSPTGIVQAPVMGSYQSGPGEHEQVTKTANVTSLGSALNRSYAPDRVIVKFKKTTVSASSSFSQVQAEAHAA